MCYERVPPEEHPILPLDGSIPLSYLEGLDDDGLRHWIYVMDTPAYTDRYVVRAMDYSDDVNFGPTLLSWQYGILMREVAALRTAGVSVPEFRACLPVGYETALRFHEDDPPAMDIVLAVDKITPVDPSTVSGGTVRQQAMDYVDGLARYVDDAYERSKVERHDGLIMCDVFNATQVMYGIPYGSDKADFHMPDIGAAMMSIKGESRDHVRDPFKVDIFATAHWLSCWTEDPEVVRYAAGRLGLSDLDKAAVTGYGFRLPE